MAKRWTIAFITTPRLREESREEAQVTTRLWRTLGFTIVIPRRWWPPSDLVTEKQARIGSYA